MKKHLKILFICLSFLFTFSFVLADKTSTNDNIPDTDTKVETQK